MEKALAGFVLVNLMVLLWSGDVMVDRIVAYLSVVMMCCGFLLLMAE
jgi:hypothetical protein